jgi:hypothetical protein
MKRYFGLFAILVLIPGLARAQFNITAQIGGTPAMSGVTLQNFDGSMPSMLTLAGAAYLVTGNPANYACPYFSGSTASFFGESTPTGPDLSQFMVVDANGSATFNFSTPELYFGLLWGSVDNYDSLSFYNGQGNLIGAVSGRDAIGSNGDFGGLGADGTYYVNITSSTPFTKVVASASWNAFEFDDVAYTGNVLPVPEPPSGAFMAWGLAIAFVAIAHQRAPKKRGKK